MSADQQVAPIIVKKIKKGGGDGHHGGAWKVAYADFVTAMMAFFLLMWLLNATTEVQRKGIADYFNPTIPINRISGGGDGAFGGDSIFSEESLAENGTGSAKNSGTSDKSSKEEEEEDEAEAAAKAQEEAELNETEEMLTGRAGESMVSADLARHIVTKVTDEGLVVELFDLPGAPLFEPLSDTPTLVLEQLVDVVSRVFSITTNEVAVAGHTRTMPIVVAENPVWDLSSGRAHAVRRLIEDGGFLDGRVQRVTGFADRKPLLENPMASRNSRIEIILLRRVR